MPTSRVCSALAFVALLGALGAVRAEPLRAACAADDRIPDFVRQRVELVSAGPADRLGVALAVELERGEPCHGASRTEP